MPKYTLVVTVTIEAPSIDEANASARSAIRIGGARTHYSVEYLDAEEQPTLRVDDCVTCDGYVLDPTQSPYCPTCFREHTTKETK